MLTNVQVLPGATSVARFGDVVVWFEMGPDGGGVMLTQLLQATQAVSAGAVPSRQLGARLAAVLNTGDATAVPALVAATPEGDGLRVVVHGWGAVVTDGVHVQNGWADQVIEDRRTFFVGRNTVPPVPPVEGAPDDVDDGVGPGDGISFVLSPATAPGAATPPAPQPGPDQTQSPHPLLEPAPTPLPGPGPAPAPTPRPTPVPGIWGRAQPAPVPTPTPTPAPDDDSPRLAKPDPGPDGPTAMGDGPGPSAGSPAPDAPPHDDPPRPEPAETPRPHGYGQADLTRPHGDGQADPTPGAPVPLAPLEAGPAAAPVPTGRLVLDDGSFAVLERSCVLGSAPHDSPAVGNGMATPLTVEGLGVAPVHAEIHVEQGRVGVRDLGSAPTYVLAPGSPSWAPLVPGQITTLTPGSRIAIGQRTIAYELP